MEFKNNIYSFQGINLLEICEKFGTPVYVYDASIIESQVEKLRRAFQSLNLRINFAVKSLSNVSILKLMRKLETGLDVVSIEEAHLGIKAGFKPNDILFTPNSVSFEEIKEAIKLGVRINIDNISILEQFGHEFHNSIPVSIRINPHIMK